MLCPHGAWSSRGLLSKHRGVSTRCLLLRRLYAKLNPDKYGWQSALALCLLVITVAVILRIYEVKVIRVSARSKFLFLVP